MNAQKTNLKLLAVIFGILIIGATLAFAIAPAVYTKVNETRWVNTTASSSDITEGGNITLGNIAGTSLTDKWAAYYGNVSSGISLSDGSTNIYTWSWTPASGGEVCITESTTFNFVAAAVATAANINTAFSLGAAADNATNTFTLSTCDLTFATSAVTDTATANHTGSAFETCAISNGTTTAKTSFAFCANIQNQVAAFDTKPVDYEIMVPTTPGVGTETYYFYVELN